MPFKAAISLLGVTGLVLLFPFVILLAPFGLLAMMIVAVARRLLGR